MFSVAICDDDELLCTKIENILLSYKGEIVQTEVYFSCEKLFADLKNGMHYDLIYLDIELEMMNGVELGSKIRNELKNDKVQIVYISAKTNYAMELFEVRPLNFLVKPINNQQVIDVLEKAIDLSKEISKYYEFNINRSYYKIAYGDIVYFESKSRKVILHTEINQYEFYAKLNEIDEQTNNEFLRIHQSFLVNPLYVVKFGARMVTLSNGKSIPVSHAYSREIRKYLLARWGR